MVGPLENESSKGTQEPLLMNHKDSIKLIKGSVSLLRQKSFQNKNVSEAELKQLTAMLEAENSHVKQWSKHLVAFICVALNLIVNYLRGNTSPIDITRCGYTDWSIFAVFVVAMFGLSWLGLNINKREQALKMKAGRGMVKSDIRYSGS